MRIGFGYDVHAFSKDRKLILGGVTIPHEVGLLGHSDADVLIHALMDAILGALALGDIGKLFPDTDMAYKDIDSTKLLKRVVEVMEGHGYQIGNVDMTIALQAPKVGKYIPEMIAILADILHTDRGNVSIKATTTEGLGFVGTKEGAAAYAVCLLEKIS